MEPTKANPPPSSSTSSAFFRMFSRRPGLAFAAMTLTGVGLGFRHASRAFRENERAQTNSPGQNLYVSVDRSGGGV
ncbi:hypothetical protein VTK26DRAFT_2621 [Humicola hyalothermophila]